MNRRDLLSLAAVAAVPWSARADSATGYPDRVIRIIAPAPPGGAYDLIARVFAQGLQKSTGQAGIVENRAGAGGQIGVEAAAHAPADGYTLLIGSTGPMSVAPSLVKNLRYDPIKDFAPIARIVKMPSYLVVNANVPVKTFREFLVYVRANPGKMSYASTGNGLSQHSNVELLKSMENLDILAVTYRGSGPAVTDLLGHQVDMMIELGPQIIPHIHAGRVRVLATTSSTRTEAMPDVPTLAESGVTGYEAFTWFGLYAPARVPKDILAKLSGEVTKAFGGVEVKARLAGIGAELALSSPDELASYQVAETKKWTEVIRHAGIQPE